MDVEFDPAKDQANRDKHGISLARAGELDVLLFLEDDRADYGERRYRAWGLIDDSAYCLAFALRDGKVRAISLRRARAREMKRYVERYEDGS